MSLLKRYGSTSKPKRATMPIEPLPPSASTLARDSGHKGPGSVPNPCDKAGALRLLSLVRSAPARPAGLAGGEAHVGPNEGQFSVRAAHRCCLGYKILDTLVV